MTQKTTSHQENKKQKKKKKKKKNKINKEKQSPVIKAGIHSKAVEVTYIPILVHLPPSRTAHTADPRKEPMQCYPRKHVLATEVQR